MGAMMFLALASILIKRSEEFFAEVVALGDEEMCVLRRQLCGGRGRLYT
jgi:hypothetical protein